MVTAAVSSDTGYIRVPLLIHQHLRNVSAECQSTGRTLELSRSDNYDIRMPTIVYHMLGYVFNPRPAGPPDFPPPAGGGGV